MIVPKKLLNKWKVLRSEHDVRLISSEVGVSTVTVSEVFRTGKCNDSLFEAMAKFYTKKAETVKQYL